jgi:hypothetical protein
MHRSTTGLSAWCAAEVTAANPTRERTPRGSQYRLVALEGLETVIGSRILLQCKKIVDDRKLAMYRRVRSIALHQLHRSSK